MNVDTGLCLWPLQPEPTMLTRLSARSMRSAILLLAMLSALGGCTHPLITDAERTTTLQNATTAKTWSGRISMQVQSDPPQTISAGFMLKGQPESGELSLVSPFGSVLGVLRWAPGQAELVSDDRSIRQFGSIEELIAKAAGAELPLGMLFSWLRGENVEASGWSADLSRYAEGRIVAQRLQPLPRAALRVVLDRQAAP